MVASDEEYAEPFTLQTYDLIGCVKIKKSCLSIVLDNAIAFRI